MIIRKCLPILAASIGIALVTSSGCVERKETITVARDGSVIIELEYEGTEAEMTKGDAMPSAESGWSVARSTKEEDKKTKVILESKRRFEPGEPLPESFAAPDDPDADLYVEFPTTLRTEQRRDGTYYCLRRLYTPRRWAYVRHWQDEFVDDNVRKLGDKPVEELTSDEQRQIVEAFAAVEAFKQLEFTAIALQESNPDLPVEHGLIARQAILRYYQEASDSYNGGPSYFDQLIAKCSPLEEDQQNECFDQETRRVLREAHDAYVQSLRDDAGLTTWQLAAFEEAYRRAERYFEITDQLGGHLFEINVVMPGTIIAHSALDDDIDVDEEENVSSVRFQFEGDWFRDRPYEMIVVSRVEHGQRGR